MLFAVPPGIGHVFPVVPLAWALRAAGHEVLVATAADGVAAVVRAGLPVVDTAPGLDVKAVFGAGQDTGRALAAQLREHGEEFVRSGGRTPDFVLGLYARISDRMAGETVRLARYWRPDVVVHTADQGAGLLAACATGVPSVEHGINFVREDALPERFLPFLAETAARLGVPDRLPERAALHVVPAEFLVGDGEGWPLRYVPYNAGGVLPDWLCRPAERPRVLVTLGTVLPSLGGLGGVAPLLAATAELDAEVLLAFGDGVDADALGPLPANTRLTGWVPLAALLASCSAIVHHGGSGTTLTALAAGVPQLVLPQAADQFVNAEVVAAHGLGVRRDPSEVDTATIRSLVADGELRVAARAAVARIRAQPAPAAVVPRLEALARRVPSPAPA